MDGGEPRRTGASPVASGRLRSGHRGADLSPMFSAGGGRGPRYPWEDPSGPGSLGPGGRLGPDLGTFLQTTAGELKAAVDAALGYGYVPGREVLADLSGVRERERRDADWG